MDGLERIVAKMVAVGLDQCDLWIDGSFVTQKQEPDDVDIVLFAPAYFYDKGTKDQREILDWLEDKGQRTAIKTDYFCHTAAVLVYPEGSHLHVLSIAQRNGWEDDFGHSVASRDPKGIAVVSVTQPQPNVVRKAGA